MPNLAEIDAALREAELAELEEGYARDCLLGAASLFHPTYCFEDFHQSLCADLDQFVYEIETRQSPRYMLFVPPQHGKSTIASRSLPARTLGLHPDWPIQISSYAVSLSGQHSRWVRNTMESQRFRNAFPDCVVSEDSAAKDLFHTTRGGMLMATGVDGGQTGHPSILSLIDDAFKNRQEADSPVTREHVKDWYATSVRTRLRDGGGILIINTRWHLDDLCGWLLDEAKKNKSAEQWKVIVYAAIAEQDEAFRKKGQPLCPKLHGLRDLEAIRHTIPARDWLALYQQRPMGDEGGYFQKAWMRSYAETPRVGDVAIAADFAVRTGQDNDRTFIAAFGQTEAADLAFLPKITLDRIDAMTAVETILDTAELYHAHTLVAGRDMITRSIGPFLQKRMQERGIWLTVKEVPETKDLEARARSYQARCQQGKVLWPEGQVYREIILPEHLAFPGSKHDDSIAGASNAVWYINEQAAARAAKPKQPENKTLSRLKERSRMQGERDDTAIPPLFES